MEAVFQAIGNVYFPLQNLVASAIAAKLHSVLSLYTIIFRACQNIPANANIFAE
ncbi:MAG: hypothetical protein K2X50_03900 [Gammaproteobacteria bacterium]|nr:hypothetical protein [Gammaproteobacteria bacterium]